MNEDTKTVSAMEEVPEDNDEPMPEGWDNIE
jgi:hypothetical protein